MLSYLETSSEQSRTQGSSHLCSARAFANAIEQAAALDKSSFQEVKKYRLSMLRESALKVVKFVVSMEDRHFREFWLPCKS